MPRTSNTHDDDAVEVGPTRYLAREALAYWDRRNELLQLTGGELDLEYEAAESTLAILRSTVRDIIETTRGLIFSIHETIGDDRFNLVFKASYNRINSVVEDGAIGETTVEIKLVENKDGIIAVTFSTASATLLTFKVERYPEED